MILVALATMMVLGGEATVASADESPNEGPTGVSMIDACIENHPGSIPPYNVRPEDCV